MKIKLVDRDKKKDDQVLQDISMTPEQRFVRMFDLIEFCIEFSRDPKPPLDKKGCTIITLKRKAV